MRILLGVALLVALCALADSLQRRFASDVRRQRQELRAERQLAAGPGFETWGRARLTIGRPSGAAPVDLPPPAPDPTPGELRAPRATSSESGIAAEEGSPPADWSPPVYEMTVQKGQVLSSICEDFYGTGRPPLPDRVAAYNGLESADSLRAGEILRLPPISMLRELDPPAESSDP